MIKTVINVCSNFLQNYPLHFSKMALPAVAMVVQEAISVRGFVVVASIGAAVFLYRRFIVQQQDPNSLQHPIEYRYLNDTRNAQQQDPNSLQHLIQYYYTDGGLSLSFYNHNLDGIPENFLTWLPNFKRLDLSGNELTTLPPAIFANLTKLEELDLSHNQLDNLSPAIFANLPNLKRLDLSHNKLTNLPKDIFDSLTNLEELDLSDTELDNLPLGIFSNLCKLKKLKITSNKLDDLPLGIFSNLPNLQQLDLSHNNLTNLPKDIFANLPNLQQVDLSHNNLTNLPKDIFANLPNLQQVDLSHNNLTNLPKDIFANLPNLQRLDLSQNNLTNLPKDIFANLPNLQRLDLSQNNLTNLPQGIFSNLSNLKRLWLSHNTLTNLPQGIFSNLSKLKLLWLSHNRLSNLPLDMFANLSNVEDIDLSYNELDNLLSDMFAHSSNLQRLDLSYNTLTNLPPGLFSNLSNLILLNLSHNTLTNLPMGIFSNLSNLTLLTLSHNELQNLPLGVFDHLTNLQRLSLSRNKLTNLSQDIFFNLSSLTLLVLSHNELISLPNSLLALTPDCLCRVFNNRLSPEAQAWVQQGIDERSGIAPIIDGLSSQKNTKRHSNNVQEEVAVWIQRFQMQFPKDQNQQEWNAHFANIPDTSQHSDSEFLSYYAPLFQLNSLHLFLENLEEIADFKSQSTQDNVILKITRILVGAVQNETFREKLDAISADATGACGDRIDTGLGLLELWWKIHCGKLNQKEVAETILGIKRTEILDTCVQTMAKANQWNDQIEFVLYFRIKLNNELGLQITTKGMRYPGMVEEVVQQNELSAMLKNIEEQVLEQSSGVENIVNILVESDIWKNVIEKSQPEQFLTIRDEAYDAMEQLEENKARMSDGDYVNNSKQITNTMEEKIQKLIKTLTEQWVIENKDFVK